MTLGSQHTIIIYSFIVGSYKSHLNDNSIFVLSTELIWHFSFYLYLYIYNIDIYKTLPPFLPPSRAHDCYRCGHRETLIHTVQYIIISSI